MECIGNVSVHTCTAAHAVESMKAVSKMVAYFISSFPLFEAAVANEVAVVAIREWLMVILIQERQLLQMKDDREIKWRIFRDRQKNQCSSGTAEIAMNYGLLQALKQLLLSIVTTSHNLF